MELPQGLYDLVVTEAVARALDGVEVSELGAGVEAERAQLARPDRWTAPHHPWLL